MKPASFEEVLEQVGSNGRYQHLLVWLFVIPLNFIIPWMVLGQIFFSATPDHLCAPPPSVLPLEGQEPHGAGFPPAALTHPPLREYNTSFELWKAVAIPKKDGELDSCHQYNVTWEDIAAYNTSDSDQNMTQWISDNYEIIGCAHGMWYDDTDYTETLPTTMGWVCDSKSLSTMWLTLFPAGNVVGILLFTPLADAYGRRPMLALTALLFAVFGSLRIYMTSVWSAMLVQFLASMPGPAMLELSIIIGVEQVSASWRSLITSGTFLAWTTGMCMLPLLAWLTGSWRILCVVTSLPFALFATSYWLLPESPSWLLSRGRVEETAKLLGKVARYNRRPVPTNLEEQLSLLGTARKAHNSPLQLLQSSNMRTRTFLLTLCFSCNNSFYYLLTYNIGNMSGNQFLNFFLMGICELPATVLGCWMSDTLGRRWSQVLCFLLASLCALVTIPLLGTSPMVTTSLLTFSKLFSTISFLVIYIQCAEIYPTSHRGTGTGFSCLISACFGIVVPYVAFLSTYHIAIPYVVLVLIGLLGIVVSSFLPETMGEDLPQNLDDAESFLLDEKYLSYKGKRPCGRDEKIADMKSSPRFRSVATSPDSADSNGTSALPSQTYRMTDTEGNNHRNK